MKIILIDSKYLGAALTNARKTSGLRRTAAAEMLNITYQELLQYERGQRVIPDHILHKIIANGLMLLRTKTGQQNK